MGATEAIRHDFLNAVLRNVDFLGIDQVFLSLHTADPGDTGASEVSGGSYARQGPVTFDAPVAGESDNANAVEFLDMPAVTVTHFGLFTAVSAGTFLWGVALDASETFTAGDTARFDAGEANFAST